MDFHAHCTCTYAMYFHCKNLMLTFVQAWQDNQLEVAEHIFAQAERLWARLKGGPAEKVVDSIYHVGKGLLCKQDFPISHKWLQRAWELINKHPLQQMSRAAVELRIAVLQALVTALMAIQSEESIDQANNLLNYAESEIGDRTVILLLRLEMLSKLPAETFDGEGYGSLISRMIKSSRHSESNFKLLVHHIDLLHVKCPGLGCSLLDELLSMLVLETRKDWIDKVVIKRVVMATSQRDFEGTVEDTKRSFSIIRDSISPEASFAAQAVKLSSHHLCIVTIVDG